MSPILFALIGMLSMVHVDAQQCILADRCDCRNFQCRLSSFDKPQSGKTGPRLSFKGARYQHGGKCDDSPYPTPIAPGGAAEIKVGNEQGVVFVGVWAFLEYAMFSDNGATDLGCTLKIQLNVPYWDIIFNGFERWELEGPGCANPPIVGPPPGTMNQARYNLQREVGQRKIAEFSFVEYYLYYKDSLADSRFFLNSERKPISPDAKVCTGKLGWIKMKESQFHNIETLDAHFYITAEEAGREEWADYDQAKCEPTGEANLEKACYRYLDVPLSTADMEFQYRGSIEYVCQSGERNRVLTSSGNMFSAYLK